MEETNPVLILVTILSETAFGLTAIDDEPLFTIMQPDGNMVCFKPEDFKKIVQGFQFVMAESAVAKRDLN